MKMDIGDERDVDLFLDLGHGLRRIGVGHGAPNQFTARLFQLMNLFDRGLHVSGIGLGHGLDRNVRSAAYLNATYIDRLGYSTFTHYSHPSTNRSKRLNSLDITPERTYLAIQCEGTLILHE